MLTLSSTSNYHEVFKPLLSINDDYEISDLIKNRSSDISGSSRGFSFFRPSTEEQNKKIAKLYRNVIKEWIELVDNHLDSPLYGARYHPQKLVSLQKVMEEITLKGKIVKLRDKTEALKLGSLQLTKTIDKLKKFVLRVLHTPVLENLQSVDPSDFFPSYQPYLSSSLITFPGITTRVSLPPLKISKNKVSNSASSSSYTSKSSIDSESLAKAIAVKSAELQLSDISTKVSHYHPKSNETWGKKLLDQIRTLDEIEKIQHFAHQLDTIQVLTVLNAFMHDQKQEWKLIYLIGALNHFTFIEMVHALDKNMIGFINGSLKKAPKKARAWFEKAFATHRENIIHRCNEMGKKINELARRFREDPKGHELSRADLDNIRELADNIRLRLRGIREILSPLFKDVSIHPATKEVLLHDTIVKYTEYLLRLTETKNYDNRPASCLFPIIYSNVFERADLEDDEEAYEIFADWSIPYPEDHWKAGLFGELSEEEFKKLNTSKTGTEMNMLQIDFLAALGIDTIADWKRLEIFNLAMFKEYLNKENNKKILTDLIRTKLTKDT